MKVKGFQGGRPLLIEHDPREVERALEATHVADDASAPWWRILADLHPKQRAAIDDPSPEKCFEKGRRGGGSVVVAAWLLEEYHRWPGATVLFIALTQEHAVSIIWPMLMQLDRKYELGIKFDGAHHTATLPNGYRILVRGAKDRVAIERFRGIEGGLRRVAIDEAGSFSAHDEQFRYMIDSIIKPQFMDHYHRGGGQIVLCGSPGLDPMGFYFEKCTGVTHDGKRVRQWSLHHWTALDNPHLDARGYLLSILPDHILDDTSAEAMLEEICSLYESVAWGDPAWADVLPRLSNQFRREYLADWVRDRDSLVYVPSERNWIDDDYELDRSTPWRIAIGCDVGWGDGNGFAVAAKNLRSREIILLEAYYRPELDTSEVADELIRLRTKYRTGEIYVDTGGAGDQRLADLENYGVIAEAAGKGRKKRRIEYVRSVLQKGWLKIRQKHCAQVITEWSGLPWSEDRQTHREGFVDDVTDAVLMAVNPLSQRFQPRGEIRPRPGDPGWEQYQEKLEREKANRAGRRIVRRKRVRLVLVEPPGTSSPPVPSRSLPLAA